MKDILSHFRFHLGHNVMNIRSKMILMSTTEWTGGKRMRLCIPWKEMTVCVKDWWARKWAVAELIWRAYNREYVIRIKQKLRKTVLSLNTKRETKNDISKWLRKSE